MEASITRSIGTTYANAEQNDKALKYYALAEELLRTASLTNIPEFAWLLRCKSYVYLKQGHYQDALHLLRQALDIYEAVELLDSPGAARVHIIVGKILQRASHNGVPTDALQAYWKAWSISEAAHIVDGADCVSLLWDLEDLGRSEGGGDSTPMSSFSHALDLMATLEPGLFDVRQRMVEAFRSVLERESLTKDSTALGASFRGCRRQTRRHPTRISQVYGD